MIFKRNKKGQIWISDYTLSLLLFVAALFIAFKILLNGFTTNSTFVDLRADASKISETFLSEGYPVNWTNNTVIKPGLLLDGRLDITKTTIAMNSSMMNYTRLRGWLQTRYDFLAVFENVKGDMLEFGNNCTIGNSHVSINTTKNNITNTTDCHYPDFSSIHYDNMAQVIRYLVYNGTIVRMVVYVWD